MKADVQHAGHGAEMANSSGPSRTKELRKMGDDLNEFLDEVSSVDDGEGRGRLAEDGDDGFDSEATVSSPPSLLPASKGNNTFLLVLIAQQVT